MSIALKQVFNKDKTFRPKRRFEPGTQRFELHKRAQASLNSGVDLKASVQLPLGEDLNDWVAVHVVDFFNRINLIYGTVCEFCTDKSCPVMSGGPRYEYRWQDEHKYKKPTPLPAPQYMNLLMDWIEMQINNEDIFPTIIGIPFPKNFIQICKKILCRLFRVFVHVYIHHFDRILLMGAEAHVNTCYKHFYYFATELNLIERKELEPLRELKFIMGEKHASSGPPLCVQLFSALALVCFGLYCIVKGVSFGLFNWWYILGAACLLATAFAAFRVYEVCVIMAQREMAEGDPCGTLP